jgi:uncharacterized protein GlcG (DUF336 family)
MNMQLPVKPVLTLEAAKRAAGAALDAARQRGLRVAIAVVDDGGRILYFERMDGVPWGSGDVALAKAQSAAAYRRDTAVFDERLHGGRMAALAQPFAFPIQGGLPYLVRSQCAGAIGASGALASEDTELVAAGVAAVQTESNNG